MMSKVGGVYFIENAMNCLDIQIKSIQLKNQLSHFAKGLKYNHLVLSDLILLAQTEEFD